MGRVSEIYTASKFILVPQVGNLVPNPGELYYFSSFPFMRLTPPLVGGILLYTYLQPDLWVFAVLAALSAAWLLADILLFKLYKQFRFRYVAGIFNLVLFFSLGVCLTRYHDTAKDGQHITRFTGVQAYKAWLCESPVEKPRSYKTTLQVEAVRVHNQWQPATGKIIAYLRKDSLTTCKYGQEIVFTSAPDTLEPPLNPGQFNYKQYLRYHGIYHRVFLNARDYSIIGRKTFRLFNFANDLQQELLRVFERSGLTGNERAVAGALVLGITDHLGPDIVRAYSSTGALHVLAVSGLHVGVIYLLLNFLLSFMDKNKRGRIIKSLLLLTLIWFYALLTGLSPSVLRSATMFSFITVGTLINRRGNIYNSIFASAFVLLIINPYIIMQVGFQLSYLAVLGIVYLYPKIYGWFGFNNYLADKVWSISAVSLSAQLATFPLGLLYYHQFPNYFFISNLIVIPMGSLVLYTGVLTLLFSPVPYVNQFLGQVLCYLIKGLNSAVMWVEKLPYALYEGISISIAECWMLYIFLGGMIAAFQYRRPRLWAPALLSLAALLCMQFVQVRECTKQHKLIVYQCPDGIALDAITNRLHTFVADSGFYHNRSSLLFYVKHNWDVLHLQKENFVQAGQSAPFINEQVTQRGPLLYFAGKKILLVTDTVPAWNYAAYGPFDLMIIYGQPKLHLKWLRMKIGKIILAGKNGYRARYWRDDAKELGIPFYEIEKQGAYIEEIRDNGTTK